MHSIEVSNTAEGRVVSIRGELVIDWVEELKDSLLTAFEGAPELKLDLSQVESSDIACIQVLCAAHRLGVKMGLKIGLKGAASAGFISSLNDISLYPAACDAPFSQSCLWKEEVRHG